MPIYKGDVVVVKGKVVQGEEVGGDEIRYPYKMMQSLTVGDVTYVFDRMEGSEAVYRKGTAPASNLAPKTQNPEREHQTDSTPTMSREDLPNGAILDDDFVGGTKLFQGRRYRLMQPVTKSDGMYVYIPV